MEIGSSTYPRVSKSVEHRVDIALMIFWVAGGVFLLEATHTGWIGQVVLLLVVLLIEFVFLTWNYGSVGAARKAHKRSPPEG